MKLAQIVRREAPANLRMASKRSCAAAGRIDKNAIEAHGGREGERLLCIERHEMNATEAEPAHLGAHREKAMRVKVSGDYEAERAGSARERAGFAARGGANIENAVVCTCVEKQRYGLREASPS